MDMIICFFYSLPLSCVFILGGGVDSIDVFKLFEKNNNEVSIHPFLHRTNITYYGLSIKGNSVLTSISTRLNSQFPCHAQHNKNQLKTIKEKVLPLSSR